MGNMDYREWCSQPPLSYPESSVLFVPMPIPESKELLGSGIYDPNFLAAHQLMLNYLRNYKENFSFAG